jgi:hypothetical protein
MGDAMQKLIQVMIGIMLMWLAGCGSGSVMFAPTPAPPDASPLRFDHPGGAFSISVPRLWSIHVQDTTALASAAFAAPGEPQPVIQVSVMNPGRRYSGAELSAFMQTYQTALRPDAPHYSPVDQQAMGDGSWRLTGLQHIAGRAQPVNTFIQQTGTFLSVMEVRLTEGADLTGLEAIINSLVVNPEAALQPAEPTVLAVASATALEIQHISVWTTPEGVLFITGEVANRGAEAPGGLPVRALLYGADGRAAAEALDVVMGHAVQPGGFAPFSLRFGVQPPGVTTYSITLGGEGSWRPLANALDLQTTSSSRTEPDGRLFITGEVSNNSQSVVEQVRVVATIFDTGGQVIAAGFTDLTALLDPGASAPYQVIIPELGGTPVNFTVLAQGLVP